MSANSIFSINNPSETQSKSFLSTAGLNAEIENAANAIRTLTPVWNS